MKYVVEIKGITKNIKTLRWLPCVTENEQNGMELIGNAENLEDAEKILKLYMLNISKKLRKQIIFKIFEKGLIFFEL